MFAYITTILSIPESFVQIYAVVLTLVLGTFFLVGVLSHVTQESLFSLYSKVIFFDVIILVMVGLFILPASGRPASFFLWHAVTATLAIISLIIAGLINGAKGGKNFFWPLALMLLGDFVIVIILWLHQ